MGAAGTGGFNAAGLLAAFCLHNTEEILLGLGAGLDQGATRLLARFGVQESDYRSDRLAIATGLLTVAAAAALHVPTTASVPRRRLAAIAAGSLAANGVTHAARALIGRSYNPGLATAPLLVGVALSYLRSSLRDHPHPARTAAAAVMIGAVCQAPAILIALGVARVLSPKN